MATGKTVNERIESAKSWAKKCGKVKGRADYLNFLEGKRLTMRKSITACCFRCTAGNDLGEDCKVVDCPLLPYSPFATQAKD